MNIHNISEQDEDDTEYSSQDWHIPNNMFVLTEWKAIFIIQ